ncbi:MAG: hypothetical protein JWN94_193 [Betaproteobacteria bacterium]|nr:hypothetical protein [Betaproteobacteria bacterium]
MTLGAHYKKYTEGRRVNRLSCVFLLLALTGNAVADTWIVVNDHDDYIAYANSASISREGDIARMHDLIDLKAPRFSPYGVSHLSSRAQSEFDCITPRMRTLEFALHADHMGEGSVVEEVAPSDDWMPVFDGTLLDKLRRFACAQPERV